MSHQSSSVDGLNDCRSSYLKSTNVKGKPSEKIYWSELTWKEKLEFRKNFLKLYLTETKQCFPYVRKFIEMIYRVSPWRLIMLLALNLAKGLLPVLTLRARGNFMTMVRLHFRRC